jgi:hypothetical protein
MSAENIKAIDTEKLIAAELLSKEEIEALLPHLDNIVAWANQVKEHALELAINGEEFQNYKVVEGRAYRKLTDDLEAAKRLLEKGYDEAIIYEPKKLLSIAKLEKIVGKTTYKALLEDLVETPQGKPTLVSISDKRPPMVLSNTAASDFSDLDGEEF